MEFDIGRTYAFQKKKSMSVEVDLWRFDVLNAAALPEIGTGVSVDRPLEFIGKGDEKVYNARQRKIQYKRRGRK